MDTGGDGYGGGYDGGYGNQEDVGDALPSILDLDGDGVEIAQLTESTALFDQNGEGFRNLTAWAKDGDGLLAYDHDPDGQITGHTKIVFVRYKDGAASDLEGLQASDTKFGCCRRAVGQVRGMGRPRTGWDQRCGSAPDSTTEPGFWVKPHMNLLVARRSPRPTPCCPITTQVSVSPKVDIRN